LKRISDTLRVLSSFFSVSHPSQGVHEASINVINRLSTLEQSRQEVASAASRDREALALLASNLSDNLSQVSHPSSNILPSFHTFSSNFVLVSVYFITSMPYSSHDELVHEGFSSDLRAHFSFAICLLSMLAYRSRKMWLQWTHDSQALHYEMELCDSNVHVGIKVYAEV
jgi:hypothetical protein